MNRSASTLPPPWPTGDTEIAPRPAASWKRFARYALPVLLLVAAGMWWRSTPPTADEAATYRTAIVHRGNVTRTIGATGPLSAVATVNVGSQVSGNIAKLYVDFNDPVAAGQLIAEIDSSTFEARVVQAEGEVLNAAVTLDLKRLAERRNETLRAAGMIAQSDYDQSLAELRQQEALVQIKEAALRSAKVDLARTRIRSPVDGVVIDRAIDVGQTVQASFAAPILFVIARDLRQMQIAANVSEADIGGVTPGCPVSFTVDAFPGETFRGSVRQVRNNTTTTNNVVTYPTIIFVDNPDLKLRPGMTANVTMIVAERQDVLRVPNAAFRFRPVESSGGLAPTGRTRVIYVALPSEGESTAADGLEPVVVQTGLSDAAFTEIISGVVEGASVVTGVSLPGKTGIAPTNPFVPKMPGHPRKG